MHMDISSWSRDNNVPVLTQGRNRNMQVKIDVPPREQNVPLQEEFWSGQLLYSHPSWPRFRNKCESMVFHGGTSAWTASYLGGLDKDWTPPWVFPYMNQEFTNCSSAGTYLENRVPPHIFFWSGQLLSRPHLSGTSSLTVPLRNMYF